MTTAFRRSAHRRFSRDIPRGRLLLQLAIVADCDGLRDLGDELAAEARLLGATGGTHAAFDRVVAAVRPLLWAAEDRDHLVWEIASALEQGAILIAPTCTVGPYGEEVHYGHRFQAYAAFRDPGGVLVNGTSTSANAAAAAFVGVRGAGAEAARAALEAWEQERPPSTKRMECTTGPLTVIEEYGS